MKNNIIVARLIEAIMRPTPIIWRENITIDQKQYNEVQLDPEDGVVILKQHTDDGDDEIFLTVETLKEIADTATKAITQLRATSGAQTSDTTYRVVYHGNGIHQTIAEGMPRANAVVQAARLNTKFDCNYYVIEEELDL